MDGPPEPELADDGPDARSDACSDAPSDPDDSGDPLRFNRWMKRSATGAILTGITMGLSQALEPDKPKPALVIEAAGEPDDPDRAIDLRFDPDSPAHTVAYIRSPSDPSAVNPPTE